MDFFAIDIETANPARHSICQIGIVRFYRGIPVREVELLIDPQQPYHHDNIAVHGITEAHTKGRPTFQKIHAKLLKALSGKFVACHTSFDQTAIAQACELHGLEGLSCQWIDTAVAVRRGWPQYSKKGYGLKNLAKEHGIEFKHHNALEDARAAGMIFCRLLTDTQTNPEDWTVAATKASASKWKNYGEKTKAAKPSEGPLSHHYICFTGSLSIPRSEAVKMATDAGAGISPSPTKKTTLVVVGEQDLAIVGDTGKSSKQRKAEQMIANEHPLNIIGEHEFLTLVKTDP